ncbi:MAG TPA: glycosyltransferase family 39 protein [Ignavibacteria bacterium]|nr:glycosyltransferase family 39 protein [Ignavibacteria bacterium]
MYATRVLAIEKFGAFLDQSQYSVAGMDSGSQPPLVIWTGYILTILFGFNEWVFKIIPLVFGLLSVIILYKIGVELFDNKTAIYSVIIFSSNFIFSIYVKRFQLDIPFTFFILCAFLFFIKYYKYPKTKYLIFCGICFGLSLMTKALVGILLPIIISAFFMILYLRNKEEISIKQFLKSVGIIVLIGAVIALPWYLYMYMKHGAVFTDYLFGFHLFQRAIEGVDDNTKPSGIFYYIKFLITILPYSLLIFYFLYTDIKQIHKINIQRIFVWVWFLIILVIVSLFKTKLESYSLLFLPAFSLLLSYFIINHKPSEKEKPVIILLVMFNLVWFFWDEFRSRLIVELKYLYDNELLLFAVIIISSVIILVLAYYIISKFYKNRDVQKDLKYLLVIIFVLNNVLLITNPPLFDSSFRLSEIKNHIAKNNQTEFAYITPSYKYNPQLSYYFEGVDIGWNQKYKWELIEINNDAGKVKTKLENSDKKFVIIEKDNINRGEYIESEKFIPESYKLIIKNHGYELWEK